MLIDVVKEFLWFCGSMELEHKCVIHVKELVYGLVGHPECHLFSLP